MFQLSSIESDRLLSIHAETESMLSPYACKNDQAIREYESKYDDDPIRTQYAVDIDKIIHNVLYNRGNDKTQVFSFFRNDDITRRASHVQLVSRISRILGKALRLNLDLIEAIAIGHDVGHTPFGHKGEEFLNELYHHHTDRYFNHNVHSVRVLQRITNSNLTVQTLDGILCHCGEKAFERYEPSAVSTFAEHNDMIRQCYTQENYIGTLRPSTLEGCVVRVSDMIAYIGKDRQDASKIKLAADYTPNLLGSNNSEAITNTIVDIIKNSADRPFLAMSKETFSALKEMLAENNDLIYQCEEVVLPYYSVVKPMMGLLYEKFLDDIESSNFNSPIYQHYLDGTIIGNFYRHPKKRFVQTDRNRADDIVVDFIASMTDDYFVDVFAQLFPGHELNQEIQYVEYFDSRYTRKSVQ